jgi:hypothetical protein
MDQIAYAQSGDDRIVPSTTRRILFITTILSTAFGLLYFVGLMGKLIINGSIHAASSQGISMISAAVGLLWDINLLVLFVALRRQISGRKAIFADLGVAFMTLLAATSSVNWYVQLTLVPKLVQSGDAALLALLDIHNTSSIMYAIEHLAWSLFFGLAVIWMALAIEGGRIETWIRWLLIAAGVMSILYIPGILISSQALIDLGYYAAGVLLPAATLLMAGRFRSKAIVEPAPKPI